MDSIDECWNDCEESAPICKAISFYIHTKLCQLFKNEPVQRIFDPQFISLTTKREGWLVLTIK
jgi:hypothetical protein